MQLAEQMHRVVGEKSQLTSSWQELTAEHMHVCQELEALRLRSTQLENQLQSLTGANCLLVWA